MTGLSWKTPESGTFAVQAGTVTLSSGTAESPVYKKVFAIKGEDRDVDSLIESSFSDCTLVSSDWKTIGYVHNQRQVQLALGQLGAGGSGGSAGVSVDVDSEISAIHLSSV